VAQWALETDACIGELGCGSGSYGTRGVVISAFDGLSALFG
jgi:hypothetical protein